MLFHGDFYEDKCAAKRYTYVFRIASQCIQIQLLKSRMGVFTRHENEHTLTHIT